MALTRITSDLIEDLTVGTGDLADSAVTAVKLAADAVTTAKILDSNVTTAKIAANAVTPAKMSQPLTHGTAVATTSGTEKDFTGIPIWVRRIIVSLNGVSLSGSALLRFRLGTSGGFATSGYLGAGSVIAATVATANQTAGFDIYNSAPAAADIYCGTIEFTCLDPAAFVWVAAGTFAQTSSARTFVTGGQVTLAAALTQVRLTTSNGTDTFDAGTINIHYE